MTRIKVKASYQQLHDLGYGVNATVCNEGELWAIMPFNDTVSLEKMVKGHNLEIISEAEII